VANSSKRKGDRAEREAVAVLRGLAPDLVVGRPQRLLGAGRREDTGDLWVFPGVTVQVKYRADPLHALRPAADAATVQAGRAGSGFAVGLVPLPGARAHAVRWVACCHHWPVPVPAGTARFRGVARALTQVRRDDPAVPRTHRLTVVDRAGSAPLFLAPVEAWVAAYRTALALGAAERSADR
jgi:hypothetical protein